VFKDTLGVISNTSVSQTGSEDFSDSEWWPPIPLVLYFIGASDPEHLERGASGEGGSTCSIHRSSHQSRDDAEDGLLTMSNAVLELIESFLFPLKMLRTGYDRLRWGTGGQEK